jgi:hypothetical protein
MNVRSSTRATSLASLRQVAARPQVVIQFGERPGRHHCRIQRAVLSLGPVNLMDGRRVAEFGYFVDPARETRIRRESCSEAVTLKTRLIEAIGLEQFKR